MQPPDAAPGRRNSRRPMVDRVESHSDPAPVKAPHFTVDSLTAGWINRAQGRTCARRHFHKARKIGHLKPTIGDNIVSFDPIAFGRALSGNRS